MTTSRIRGLGVAAPATQISSEEGCELALKITPGHDPEWVRALYRDSGVNTRSSVVSPAKMQASASDNNGRGPTTRTRLMKFLATASELTCKAAQLAMHDAAISSNAITHLVTVSCTGAESPGLDHALIDQLSLSPGISRTHIGFMGCHGALNGLAVADAFARSDPSAVVLVACCELCSLHYQCGSVPRDQLVANAIFADGAACAIITLHGEGATLSSFQSRVFHDTKNLMRWSIGDHGFEMQLSARVPVMLRRSIAPWLEQWLSSRGLTCAEIASWAIHPGGRDIIECIEQGLELAKQATGTTRKIYREHGNMSSGTVLWVVQDMLRSGLPLPIVAMSFGPGLSGEALLIGQEIQET